MLGWWIMRKLLAIVVLGLLFSGNAYAKAKKGDILYKDKDKIHIVTGGLGPSVWPLARNHCGNDKFIYEVGMGLTTANKLSKIYVKKGRKDVKWRNVTEFYCSAKNYEINPPRSTFPGKKYYNKQGPVPKVSNNTYTSTGNSNSTSSNNSRSAGMSFTINDKKEQCAAIGFKPQTEKFADCVLKLVELDIKSQANNRTVATQNNSNQQIAKELEKQNNLRQSQFLMNLSKQLLTPNAPASLPSTSNCTVRGTGVNKSITCY